MSRTRPLILVADDDPDILELVTRALGQGDYDALQACDGAQALALALERVPDLAVLDMMMPHFDGCEVTSRLRDNHATRAMPVILLTAFAEETHAARGLSAGASAYMPKPFMSRELRALVHDLLHPPDESPMLDLV